MLREFGKTFTEEISWQMNVSLFSSNSSLLVLGTIQDSFTYFDILKNHNHILKVKNYQNKLRIDEMQNRIYVESNPS